MPDDARSLASPRVAADDYSCMSLYFDPPLPQFVRARFIWAIGRKDNTVDAGKGQFWFEPGPRHVPEFDIFGNALRIIFSETTMLTASADYFSESQSSELKWCYFGADPSPGPEDILELDRLELVNTREKISEPSVLTGYCSALDLSASQCPRLSAIVFDDRDPDSDDIFWNPIHSSAAPDGGIFAAASRFSSFEQPSCLSLQFDPPWPPHTRLSFWWDFSSSDAGLRNTGMQVWLNPGPGHNPLVLDTENPHSRGSIASGFAGWEEHRWNDFGEPIDAVKWCYFSGQTDVSSQDFGRIDRLSFQPSAGETTARLTIGDYCTALNMADRYCERVRRIRFSGIGSGSYFWNAGNPRGLGSPPDDARSVASPRVAAGDYGCMSLYFDPPLPQFVSARFVWAIGSWGRLKRNRQGAVLVLSGRERLPVFDPQGNSLQIEDSGTGATAFSNFVAETQADELKWCYFGANPSPGPEDILELDRLELINTREEISERSLLDGYCSALDLPAWQCQRLSVLVFDDRYPDSDGILWDSSHSTIAPEGGAFAVASPPSTFERPTCLGLQFAPPWPTSTQLSFWWDFAGVESDSRDTGMQVWLNPGPDHNPLVPDAADAHSRVQNASGFAGWEEHRWDDFGAPIDAVKWCYFSGQTDVSSQDLGRIDRLRFALPAGETTERLVIEEYCTALNLLASDCDRLGRVRFSGTGSGSYFWISERSLLDGYCSALDLPAWQCQRLSVLVFDDRYPDSDGILWDSSHSTIAPEGGAFAVASPPSTFERPTCLGLQFAPPWPTSTQLSFWWDFAGVESDSRDTGMQVWLNPGPDHNPLVPDAADAHSRVQNASGFAGWEEHRWDDFGAPIDAVKWCYFSGQTDVSSQDLGRIDRLRFALPAGETTERLVIEEYCTALNLLASDCDRLGRVRFEGPAADPISGTPAT